jgi:hypothetical protein
VLLRIELLIEWDQNEQRSNLNVYMLFIIGYVLFDINSISGSVCIQPVIDVLPRTLCLIFRKPDD